MAKFFSRLAPAGVRVRPYTAFRQGEVVEVLMYRVRESIRSTHGQDGAVVLDIRQGQMFNLNLAGSHVLELLKSGSSETAVVDQISKAFQVSRDLAEKDVREFIECLQRHHILEDPASDSHS
ncbi:MAG TPA: PqqD family protein [Candidatus Binatia bacterium]|nr:PqqD family protein [Candidatus Binatia bacterium]